MGNMLKSEVHDETLETARINLGEVRAKLEGGPEPTGGLRSGQVGRTVSVTQSLRLRRSKNRGPSRLLAYAPPRRVVSPWADAAFPAVVSLMFTGPAAFNWMRDGKVLPALLIVAGVAGATFTLVSLLSRGLDRVPDETGHPGRG